MGMTERNDKNTPESTTKKGEFWQRRREQFSQRTSKTQKPQPIRFPALDKPGALLPTHLTTRSKSLYSAPRATRLNVANCSPGVITVALNNWFIASANPAEINSLAEI